MGRGNWNGKGEPMSRGARLYAWLLYVVVGDADVGVLHV